MEGLKEYISHYGTYLEDLRQRIYRLVIVFCVSFTLGFFLTGGIVKKLIHLFKVPDATIVATSPFQLFDLAMSIGLFTAIVVTLPLGVHQLYAFIRPGLLQYERRFFFVLLPVGIGLFLLGFTYGFLVMYFSLGVVAAMNVQLGITNLWDISQFISLVMITAALLGVLFEFPLILAFLVRNGVLSRDFLVTKRRHAYVVILLFVILLPPTDGLSDIIIAAPLVLLYEATLLISSRRPKRYLLH